MDQPLVAPRVVRRRAAPPGECRETVRNAGSDARMLLVDPGLPHEVLRQLVARPRRGVAPSARVTTAHHGVSTAMTAPSAANGVLVRPVPAADRGPTPAATAPTAVTPVPSVVTVRRVPWVAKVVPSAATALTAATPVPSAVTVRRVPTAATPVPSAVTVRRVPTAATPVPSAVTVRRAPTAATPVPSEVTHVLALDPRLVVAPRVAHPSTTRRARSVPVAPCRRARAAIPVHAPVGRRAN